MYAVAYIKMDLMKLNPRPDKPAAAYRKIEEHLRTRISRGDWAAGAMLPGRRELAREYGVSPITVERAVSPLLADGTLRADNRCGTFVAQSAMPGTMVASSSLSEAPLSDDHALTTRLPGAKFNNNTATLTVGIIASLYFFNCDHLELNNYLVRTLLDSIEAALSEVGAQTRFYNRVVAAGKPLLTLEQSLASAATDGVDAIVMIALGLDPAVVDESLAVQGNQGVPLVCITSSELRRPVPHVFYDNYSAGFQAAQHLLHGNHRRLLMLAPFKASWVEERLAGMRSAVEYAKLPPDALQVFPTESRPWINEEDPVVLGYQAGVKAFSEGVVPSAVLCANDGVAFGFVKSAQEQGKVIGRDVAVLGFDNHPRSIILGITSLRAPMESMGGEAARMLMREVHGEGTGFQVRLRWRLIPRESTRATASGEGLPG